MARTLPDLHEIVERTLIGFTSQVPSDTQIKFVPYYLYFSITLPMTYNAYMPGQILHYCSVPITATSIAGLSAECMFSQWLLDDSRPSHSDRDAGCHIQPWSTPGDNLPAIPLLDSMQTPLRFVILQSLLPNLIRVLHSHMLLPTRFWTWPFGSLLFENETSDARDHCANERSSRPHMAKRLTQYLNIAFLSYLRLSIYMAVVSVAIVLSFHLKTQPTDLELRMARPLGATFWALSVCCLFLGVGNYSNRSKRRMADVCIKKRTQLVRIHHPSLFSFDFFFPYYYHPSPPLGQKVLTIVAISIVGTCIVLLVVAKISSHATAP
ncbi:hypothetical protein ACRALDRAFT_2016023 [Sodiomyces alcalophilus JCM 7366]|uniref:uncharacterized protein n=1 Tax=Sodiomyces alcalophilus JCM 7366 TaxID=591952 RepID=UPI0039B370AD